MNAEPNVEQVAWATMAVGVVRQAEQRHKNPGLASWMAAMRIAQLLAERDVRRAAAAQEVP